MGSLFNKITEERQNLGQIAKGSMLAQVEATMAVARSNLLVAEAIAKQTDLAEMIAQNAPGLGYEDDRFESDEEAVCEENEQDEDETSSHDPHESSPYTRQQ